MASKTPTGSRTPMARVAELAARQHGVVSRRQLRDAGFSDSGIGRALEDGLLHPVFRSVYAFGHRRIEKRGRMVASVLTCSPDTLISHRSAAALLGLLDRAPVVVDVIAPGDCGRHIDGIKAHKGPMPIQDERSAVAGIPCTSPARTLADLAAVSSDRTLRNAFETAAYRRQLDLDAIEAVMSRGRRIGAPTLRTLVAEWRSVATLLPTQPKLRSPLEARVLPLLARTDLPAPEVNAPVSTPGGTLEVDLLWRVGRLAVELDSRAHHGTDVAFERDRWRDRELMRAGHATLRPTWHQVEHEPEAVIDAIRRELGARLP